MKPTTQTILHDPENGLHGNCFSAVLASLLHLPIESIPVFSDREDWRKEVNDFLRPYGLAYMIVSDFDTYCEENGISGCHHEIAGFTKRSADVWHACVAADGNLIFDPHPSRDGLTEAKAHGLFIALRPWRLVAPKTPIQSATAKPFPAPGAWFPTGVLGHPMRMVEPDQYETAIWPSESTQAQTTGNKVQLLRKALSDLVGVDTPADLKQMEAMIRMLPVPDSDRAITINAIQALLQTADETSHIVESSGDVDRWQLRCETLRALYPSAPSDQELDAAIGAALSKEANRG